MQLRIGRIERQPDERWFALTIQMSEGDWANYVQRRREVIAEPEEQFTEAREEFFRSDPAGQRVRTLEARLQAAETAAAATASDAQSARVEWEAAVLGDSIATVVVEARIAELVAKAKFEADRVAVVKEALEQARREAGAKLRDVIRARKAELVAAAEKRLAEAKDAIEADVDWPLDEYLLAKVGVETVDHRLRPLRNLDRACQV